MELVHVCCLCYDRPLFLPGNKSQERTCYLRTTLGKTGLHAMLDLLFLLLHFFLSLCHEAWTKWSCSPSHLWCIWGSDRGTRDSYQWPTPPIRELLKEVCFPIPNPVVWFSRESILQIFGNSDITFSPWPWGQQHSCPAVYAWAWGGFHVKREEGLAMVMGLW